MGGERGLAVASQCVPVKPGYWSPTGSASAEPCPSSGFFCPGQLLDSLYNGSKPIIATTGKVISAQMVEVEEVVQTEVVVTTLTLDGSAEDADLETIKAKLATLYGTTVSAISLALSSGSVILELQIRAAAGTNLSALAAAMLAVGDGALSLAIGSPAARSAPISQVVT